MAKKLLPIVNAHRHLESGRANRIVELFRRRTRMRRGDSDAGGVTVDPNRPGDLSGGAAAALEFDD
jgi:hypothetical protein